MAASKKQNTSWEHFSGWYDRLLKEEGTYQKDLILPNLLRLMELRKGDVVLDLACGQGFFTKEFLKTGAAVIGSDASQSLVRMAKKNVEGEKGAMAAPTATPHFYVAKADKLNFLHDASVDKIAIILALQNIGNVADVLRECARVLKKDGSVHIVMNHPAFRIPKESSWGWDDEKKIQYRRIDRYLSEQKAEIQMHPGGNRQDDHTLSFHRPLQFYCKALRKAGFFIAGLEEWNSNRKSEPGPRSVAEDIARKEIPLFMYLEGRKMAG